MNILSLEGYYSGSHQAFIDGLIANSSHKWQLLTAPGHSWKWRMRHTSVTFAREINALAEKSKQTWNAIFCTDMTNLAELKGLCPCLADIPAVLYFHENQSEYPNQTDEPRDIHFVLSNMISALAADEVWFNSAWNRDSFFAGLEKLLTKLPQPKLKESIKIIAAKSSIQPPAITPQKTLYNKPPLGNRPLNIIWAGRWEHDKRPDIFFDALRLLAKNGIDFRLNVMGESFKNSPTCFDKAKRDFNSNIDHWGFAANKRLYYKILGQSDVAVSTAEHEFFGLTMLEAAVQGTAAIVPNALAYPEIFGPLGIYHNNTPDDLAEKLTAIAKGKTTLPCPKKLSEMVHSKHTWPVRIKQIDNKLETLKKS